MKSVLDGIPIPKYYKPLVDLMRDRYGLILNKPDLDMIRHAVMEILTEMSSKKERREY